MPDLSAKRFPTYIALFLAYILVWADILFAIPEPAPFSITWFIVSALKNIVRIVFTLYIASQMPIFATHQWKRALKHFPSRPEITKAFSAMLLSLGCAGVGMIVSWLSGMSNPLFTQYRHVSALALLPFIILSSVSVGYAEELFFRFFLIDGLVETGISINIAASGSILIFALSHYAQGLFGIAFAAVLAVFYTNLRFRGYGLHSLALGHALYDAIVLLIVLA
jgi:hypothetical protein